MADKQWEVRFSASRSRAYFYSNLTKESVWDKPPELSDEDIQRLPGAKHLAAHSSSSAPPSKVRASHLLVKHRDSRRPGSWKTEVITISKDEAIKILKGHQAALLSAPDLRTAFTQLAKKESDCSSARDGGDLGWFGPKQMQKPFEDATYGTPIGQMSDIVSTESGVHLILRTG